MPASQSDVNLYHCSRKEIEERFCPCVNNAVVFLDACSAEVIHWNGGASVLFDYGALDVREFSSFEVMLLVKCFISSLQLTLQGSVNICIVIVNI